MTYGKTGRYRASYTASDTWALVEMIKRVPNYLSLTLGPTDKADLIKVLDIIQEKNFCQQRIWAMHTRGMILNGIMGTEEHPTWSRNTVITLMGMLYSIAYGTTRLFDGQLSDWAHDFYSTLADAVDIELI